MADALDIDVEVVELVPYAPAAGEAAPLGETTFRADAWLPEETARLRAMFDAGEDFDVIAEAIGRGRQGVRWRAWQLGLRRRSNRPWSELEDAEILKRYGFEPAAVLAQAFGRSASAVYMRAQLLDVTREGAPNWSGWEDAQLRAGYAQGVAVPQIAALIGRSVAATFCRASGLGVRHRNLAPGWTPAELDRALELAHEGRQYPVIAKMLAAEGFPPRTKAGLNPQLKALGYRRGWGRPWTPDEDAVLRQAYAQGDSLTPLQAIFGRDANSIRSRASVIGLRKTHARPGGWRVGPVWSAEEEDMLRTLYGTMPGKQLAERMGRPLRAIYTRACCLGLKHPWMRAFTEDEDLAIRIAWARGLSQTDLARALHRDVTVVSKRAIALGHAFSDPSRPPAPRTLARNRGPATLASILAMGLPAKPEGAAA
ncbi:MAG: hypothetical protein P4L73_03505 [Caulobacteraceae bacterium]|nr:hypothetical protein [Caulobacteraceae bacterium]